MLAPIIISAAVRWKLGVVAVSEKKNSNEMTPPIAIEGKNAKPPSRGTATWCTFRWFGWSK